MFYQCWLEVTKQSRYRDKWLSDETFLRAVKAQFPSLESLGFDRGAMNRAISKGGGIILDDFTVSNTTGLFRRQARGLCPFSNQKRNIWGYYITTPGGLVERPPDGKTNFLSLLQDESINDRYSIARGMPEIVDLTTQISQQSTIKRKAQAQLEAEDKAKKLQHGTASSMIVEQTYWDSSEAKKLFLGSVSDNRNVVEVLQQRIERLQQVNRSVDGWRDLVDKHDKDNLCSAYDIFIIRQRSSILCLAYTMALEEMNSARWVEDCCTQAIFDSSKMGIEAAGTNERTVAGWNILLRANRERFPHPNPNVHKERKPLPDLLEYFQDEITIPWHQYCIENLADLTIEFARNELVSKIIPAAFEAANNNNIVSGERDTVQEGQHDCGDEDVNNGEETNGNNKHRLQRIKADCLLGVYIESPISLSTTWRWLRRLGFAYDSRKKTFFVDGHERPNVVFHRNQFCKDYLSKLEPRCHRWIQVTKETVERWKHERLPLNLNANAKGYSYLSDDGIQMVEFHVDDHDFLHDVAKDMGYGVMGGNLSVRKSESSPSKPLMIFGQDESVFNQYLIGNRQWVGPEGQRALLPKTEGMGLMLSAFQSRETGFGLKLSRIQISEITRHVATRITSMRMQQSQFMDKQ